MIFRSVVKNSSKEKNQGFLLPVLVATIFLFLGSGCVGKSRIRPPGSLTLGQKIVSQAKSYIGIPYRYGGSSPQGFDCSGLTSYVYARFGYELPRRAKDQLNVGAWILQKDLRPGDLVFFRISKNGGFHVGIFAGHGQFIHAPRSGKKVETQRLNHRYYRLRYYTARRVLPTG